MHIVEWDIIPLLINEEKKKLDMMYDYMIKEWEAERYKGRKRERKLDVLRDRLMHNVEWDIIPL